MVVAHALLLLALLALHAAAIPSCNGKNCTFSGTQPFTSTYCEAFALTDIGLCIVCCCRCCLIPQSSNFQNMNKTTNAIYFNANSIKNIPAGFFSGMTLLRSLYFANNNLANMTTANMFAGATALQCLDLKYNSITGILGAAFQGLSNLQVMYVKIGLVAQLLIANNKQHAATSSTTRSHLFRRSASSAQG